MITSPYNGLSHTPFGQKRHASYNAEALFSRTFEDLLALYRWDFFHVNLPMRSKAGFPDYMLMRERLVFVELKARNPITNKIGKLSAEQIAFHERLRRARAEVHTFLLPDDWLAVDEALK